MEPRESGPKVDSHRRFMRPPPADLPDRRPRVEALERDHEVAPLTHRARHHAVAGAPPEPERNARAGDRVAVVARTSRGVGSRYLFGRTTDLDARESLQSYPDRVLPEAPARSITREL